MPKFRAMELELKGKNKGPLGRRAGRDTLKTLAE
jgi:hypothetical protein